MFDKAAVIFFGVVNQGIEIRFQPDTTLMFIFEACGMETIFEYAIDSTPFCSEAEVELSAKSGLVVLEYIKKTKLTIKRL